MFSKYFGSYLLNQGILSPEALKEAIDRSESTHVKLGVLAINAGLLNAAQVEEIQGLQRSMDKKFGEIAELKGYLNRDQVQRLLQTQKSGYVQLSQAIIDSGFLSLDELERALKGYREESGLSADQFQALQEGDIDQVVHAFLDFSQVRHAEIYYSFVSLFIKNVIRFIDEIPAIDGWFPGSILFCPLLAAQEMEGSLRLTAGLAMEEPVFKNLADRFAGMETGEAASELCQASVTEFLNLHNGLFIVNMDDQGIKLDLKPPTIARSVRVEQEQAVVIPCTLKMGQINLIISREGL